MKNVSISKPVIYASSKQLTFDCTDKSAHEEKLSRTVQDLAKNLFIASRLTGTFTFKATSKGVKITQNGIKRTLENSQDVAQKILAASQKIWNKHLDKHSGKDPDSTSSSSPGSVGSSSANTPSSSSSSSSSSSKVSSFEPSPIGTPRTTSSSSSSSKVSSLETSPTGTPRTRSSSSSSSSKAAFPNSPSNSTFASKGIDFEELFRRLAPLAEPQEPEAIAERQIEETRRSITAITEQKTAVEKQLAELTQQARSSADEAQRSITAITEQKITAEKQLAELTQQARSSADEAQRSITAITEQKITAERQLEEHASKIAALENTLRSTTLANQSAQLQAELLLDQHRSTVSKLENELATAKEDLLAATSRLEKRYETLSGKKKRLAEEKAALEATLESMQKEKHAQQLQFLHLTASLEQKNDELHALTMVNMDLAHQVKTKDSASAELARQLEELRNRLRQLLADHAIDDDELAIAQPMGAEKISRLESELKAQLERESKLQSAFEDTVDELLAAKNELLEMQNSRESSAVFNEAKVAELEEVIQRLEDGLASRLETIETVSKEKEALAAELHHSKNALEEQTQIAATQVQLIDTLEKQIAALKKSIVSKKEKIAALSLNTVKGEELDRVEAALEKSKEQIAHLQHQLSLAKQGVDETIGLKTQELEERVEKLEQIKKETEQLVNRLRKELQETMEDRDFQKMFAEEASQAVSKSLAAHSKDAIRLEKIIEELKDKIQHSERDLAEAKKEIATYQDHIAALTLQVHTLNK